MKIAFVTFGCRLNHAEALDLEASLSAAGHTIVPLPAKNSTTPFALRQKDKLSSSQTLKPSNSQTFKLFPDAIIVRSCSVTAKAENDCDKEIARLRRRFPNAQILITGCHPDASPLPLSLRSPYPSGSDPNRLVGLVGPDPITRDHTHLGSDPNDSNNQVGSDPNGSKYRTFKPSNLQTFKHSSSTSRAYLKIQDGCSGKCAFCIVPRFRGPPVSIPFDDVVARAGAFLNAGYREIVVTGCNLSLYRDAGNNLGYLLESISRLAPSAQCLVPSVGALQEDRRAGGQERQHRIRLGSIEPGLIDSNLIDVFEANPNICRFIHLSLQSGSDPILAAMKRPYRIASVADFVQDARRRLGQFLTLGADVITGFPGETDADFESTRSFLAEHNFTNVHVFPFSERPGTPAATMPGGIPVETRRARAKVLADEALARKRRFAESFVGRTVEVCVEKGGDHGWTGEYLPVRLKTLRPRRSLAHITVSSADQGVLFE